MKNIEVKKSLFMPLVSRMKLDQKNYKKKLLIFIFKI